MRHRKPPPRVLDERLERVPSGSAGRSRAADGREFSKTDYEALAEFRFSLRRFLRYSEEGARAAGITPQQHQLLLAIKGRPSREWASLSDIAESLQVRHHAAVGLVDRSARARLVRRTPDPDDRRQVRVRLTAKGEAILARLSRRNRSELRALRRTLRIPFLEDSAD
ncbi:MAG TPA: MarR family transcriptional regulator [Candidatus Bathyarchaeia archaeon]|nr:MarR family transcriptional regulator [Candidatus Bathyarchaeia archaeon]